MTAFSLCDLPAYFARDGYSDYVIEGVLPIGVTVAYGPTGTGKTGLAVATAMAVVTGSPWAGRSVSKGAVVYAATEDIEGVKKRLHGAASIAGGVHFLPVHGTDEATRLADQDPEKALAAIERRIAEVGVAANLKLIVVDTLAVSFGPFSQDDSNHAAAFMANMATLSKRYGCAVLVVHHTGKDGSMRGSQVFKDAADALLRLNRGSNAGDPTVTVEKQKNGPKEGIFSFTIGSTSIERGTEEVRRISVQAISNLRETTPEADQVYPEKLAPETGAQVVWRVLVALSARVSAVKVDDWRQACFQAGSNGATRVSSSTFSKQLKALQEKGKISVRRNLVSILVSGNFLGNNRPPVSDTIASPPLKGGVVGNVGEDPWEEALEEALEGVDERTARKRRAG